MSIRSMSKRLERAAERLIYRLVRPTDWGELEPHIHPEQRAELEAAFRDPERRQHLGDWLFEPFASWARMPDGFVYPRELIAWFLNPTRDWFIGHACESCGMGVPLLITWTNDPDPPPDLVVFPKCPSCGGLTSFAATFQSGEDQVARRAT